MIQKKRCTKLSIHRAHDYVQLGRTYHCTGVAEEAQDPNYAASPYYSAPMTPYYEASSYSSSGCDSSSSSSDSYSSSSDSGSDYSSSCE